MVYLMLQYIVVRDTSNNFIPNTLKTYVTLVVNKIFKHVKRVV